jgi:tetratricopeptide (TPR) repeat protein
MAKLTLKVTIANKMTLRSMIDFRFLQMVLVLSFCITAASPVLSQALSQEDAAKAQELFNAGNALLGKGEARQAELKYTEALAVAPNVPMLYINRGIAFASQSKFQEAISDSDKALELLGAGSFPQSYSAVAYQTKGLAHQNQGNYKLAGEFYSKAIELDPTNAKFWNFRGITHQLQNQNDEALKDFTKAIELDATIPHFFVNRGEIYRRLKDLTAALRDCDSATQLDKSNDMAYYNRGNTYIDLGKKDEALNDFNTAISLKPKSVYFYGRGRLYFIQGKYELAVKDNTEALATDPQNSSAYGNRGLSYSKLGKDTLAIEDLRKALTIKDDSAWLRYNLSYLLFKTGQFSAAAAESTKVIGIAPQWRAAYNLRAAAYAKLGNVAKAKADRDAAAKLPAASRPAEDSSVFSLDIIVPENTNK